MSLTKETKKNSTWLSRAPRVYIKSWNTLPLLCLELLGLVKLLPALSEELQVETVSLQQQQPSLPRFWLQDPLQERWRWEATFPSDGLVAEGQSGRSKGLAPTASMEKSLQKEPLGSSTPAFTRPAVASHKPSAKSCSGVSGGVDVN